MTGILGKSGDYRKLHSFNFATIVHLATIRFCARFIDWKEDPLGKTAGQMVGASRSGKQNKSRGLSAPGPLLAQEAAFLESGGIRERMTKARIAARSGATPTCPECGKPMRKRTSGKGDFWGCSAYPDCRGTRNVGEENND